MVSRNIGILSPEEQERIFNSCVSIAGCGGIGGLSAIQFARMGFNKLRIADFDHFELPNIGRQACSTSSSIGKSKVETLGKHLRDINPGIILEMYSEGINKNNVDDFVKDADIVIDGIDISCFYNSVLLHRSSRKSGICYIVAQAVAFGVSVFVFSPYTTDSETFVGLKPNSSRAQISELEMTIDKFCPYIPDYIDHKLVETVSAGEITPPNMVMPLHLATSIAVSESVLLILDRAPMPRGPNPRTFILDLQDRHFEYND